MTDDDRLPIRIRSASRCEAGKTPAVDRLGSMPQRPPFLFLCCRIAPAGLRSDLTIAGTSGFSRPATLASSVGYSSERKRVRTVHDVPSSCR